ncbi:MAG: UDP-N-acetylmuramate--L-alanine ligase [Oscillospiraceae bacterium]|nr:UDP-N-acetylmuramate--L-alanine ligase [Oscillospiraceae bacterium]
MPDFSTYYHPGAKGHLVGIGGVSMAPLAEVLRGAGLEITGSDFSESDNVRHLRSLGITVFKGHHPENLCEGLEFLVRTAAVHDDNPEIKAARERGIPVFERAQAWGEIMKDYRNAICISGTHGKTTTTSMCTHIMMAAEKDPTVMIGGTLPLLQAGHRVGKGESIILESCEYYDSFLSFNPTVAVVLNIEADHLDYFKDLADVEKSFRAFAEKVPQDGLVVLNADDANTVSTMAGLERNVVTFGLDQPADVTAKNIRFVGGGSVFELWYKGELLTEVALSIPGIHNVKNALAAAAATVALGCDAASVRDGLARFHGAGRRFEFKGKYRGADVYDDYAHHPGELKALLDAVENMDYKRTVVVFQPHTYSRTQALFNDFVAQLRRPDLCLLSEIYAAREVNTIGISSADLAARIPNARFFADNGALEQALRELCSPGDLILTVGAGDVYRIGEHLLASEE